MKDSIIPDSPFDAVAAEYDTFDENIVIPRLRAEIIQTCLRYFKPGTRILELNAGTCTDAIALAHHGIEVYATDASEQMLAVGRQKIIVAGLDAKILVQRRSFDELDGLSGDRPIRGIFSNFGGLNCGEDLGRILREATKPLASGDPAILCILNRFCFWEVMRYAIRGQFARALRRFSANATQANIGGGAVVRVKYYSPRQVILMVSEYLIPVEIYGVSILSPLPNSNTFMKRFPKLTSILLNIDRVLNRLPVFRSAGDHFVLVARKK